jgi:hypothetical protein
MRDFRGRGSAVYTRWGDVSRGLRQRRSFRSLRNEDIIVQSHSSIMVPSQGEEGILETESFCDESWSETVKARA